MEYEWYTQDDSHTAALYAARVVFPYLLTGNVRDATKSLRLFTSRLTEANKGLAVQDVSTNSSDMRIYPSLPLLNFLGLLLLAVQKGSAGLFTQLKSKYAVHIKEAGIWDEALTSVAEMYFGIFDVMANGVIRSFRLWINIVTVFFKTVTPLNTIRCQ